ncbi:uncharacterized protein LOC135145905 [Zophobas morio]|uniref:uncharacterized protein LOC135145905 n=1 Tax=Zophobas morio TaxID=2755281 RepID=UPI0030838FC1
MKGWGIGLVPDLAIIKAKSKKHNRYLVECGVVPLTIDLSKGGPEELLSFIYLHSYIKVTFFFFYLKYAKSTLSGLLDSDFHVKLFNLRFIKNEIIGSCNKKLKYLQSGLLSEIEKILSNEAHPSLLIEACVIVGSLAYGDKECLTALFASNLLPTLTLFLNHKDDNVAEAAIRSIKIVYTCDFTYKFTLKDESLLVVVELLSSSSATIVENALKLISISCRTPERQLLVVNYPNLSAVKKIIEFLSSHNPKLQESSLQTLASLIHSNKQAAKVILCNFPDLQKTLYHFLKRTPDSIRLAACCCLAYLNKLNMLNNKSALFSMLLPLLVRLSSSGTPTIRIQSLNTLAFFIAEEPKLQKAACESELLKNLHEAFDNTRNDNERDLIQYQEELFFASH